MSNFRKGSAVSWKWGSHTAYGKIVEAFTQDVSRVLKGQSVTRKASREEPAYLIEQDDGDRVLKSVSEITDRG